MVQSGCKLTLRKILTFRYAEESRCKCLKLSFFGVKMDQGVVDLQISGRDWYMPMPVGFSLFHVVVFLAYFGFKLFWGEDEEA